MEAEARIRRRLPDLVDTLFLLAEGVRVQEQLPDGRPATFTRPPDRRAAVYLMDRVMGRPTERLEHEIRQLSDDQLRERTLAALALVGRNGCAGPGAAR